LLPKKGARIIWVLEGHYLVVTGFSRQSERQLTLLRVHDLEEVASKKFDVSPTIMIPYYDADSSTLFVTGKGESQVFTYEIAEESPHLFELSTYRPSGLHQGFAFLPKIVCSIKDVEFARAFRLSTSTIEPIAFTVPRVKTAFFQDDLFPETRVVWKPTVQADEWLSGSTRQPETLSLKPEGMKALSDSRSNSEVGLTQPRVQSMICKPKNEKENAPPGGGCHAPTIQEDMIDRMRHTVKVKDNNADEWSD